jgi:hypothetical protein
MLQIFISLIIILCKENPASAIGSRVVLHPVGMEEMVLSAGVL